MAYLRRRRSCGADVGLLQNPSWSLDGLEDNRCIDNFRIAAGEKGGFREGWFSADLDAYEWPDATAQIMPSCGCALRFPALP